MVDVGIFRSRTLGVRNLASLAIMVFEKVVFARAAFSDDQTETSNGGR
jgi:hypothetical protein